MNGVNPKCYICKQECFHYLAIVWCQNINCENYNQTDSDLPHHIVTFADMDEPK